MNQQQISLLALTAAAATVAFVAQPQSDITRTQRRLDTTLMVRPDAGTISVAAMGFDEMVADVNWVRTVLTFGERYDRDASAEWRTWLAGMVDVSATLDPHWLTVYQYGGGMLRVVGEIDASSALYERCAERLPDNAWCPFALGMNLYLNKGENEKAAEWITLAADRPGAPGWWSAAAGRMKTKSGGLSTALHFIEDQLEANPPEAEREYLQRQRARLQHDMIVEAWTPKCREFLDKTGARLGSPQALADLGIPLPENPRGDAWVVGGDGVVRSESAEAERIRRVRIEDWALLRPLSQ